MTLYLSIVGRMARLSCLLALVSWTAAGSLWAQSGDVAGTSSSPSAADRAKSADLAKTFEGQVAPLLAQHCLECHDAAAREGGLDLSRKREALAGGDSGKVIVPGDSAGSLLWDYVKFDDMPLDRPPLSDEEKRLLQEWIDDGAVWSGDAIDPLAYKRSRNAAYAGVRRLTVPEYIETVRAAVGVDIEEDARRLLPPDLRADGFSNTAYNLTIDLGHIQAYAELAEIIVGQMDVPSFVARYTKSRDLTEANIRKLVSRMGKWLLRGPLEEHEIAAFAGISAAVAEDGGGFEEAARCIIEAMLQSPRFIYRIEKQRGDGTTRPVDDYELASRLSYILWGGPPDKELMRAADAGELSDRQAVKAQVSRMLGDPRAIERSARFVHEWLNLDRLRNLSPNPERFPGWNDQLEGDMRDETIAFFHDVAWKQERPLSDLLNAQVTYLTPRLAAHYGLDPQDPAGGPDGDSLASAPERIDDGLLVLYTFQEEGGDLVRDTSGAEEPIHLKIADTEAIRWTDEGLVVLSSTLIQGDHPPKRLIDAVKESEAITLEAWITPANTSQSGPARILTLSSSPTTRNFTLGQEGDKFDVRFRATKTSENGLPSVSSPGGTVESRPTHVVYTRDATGRAKLYVDGDQQAAGNIDGHLSNWSGGHTLAIANELSNDRPWEGTLHLVAVYDRALSAAEVQRNRAAGARKDGPPALAGKNDLLALYRFDETRGDTIRDASGAGKPLDLEIEDASGVTWSEGGLAVKADTLIATADPPKRLMSAIKESNALTLEAWLTPANTSQSGPARILTLSSGTGQRNFTLGQDGDSFDVRVRATRTSGNGLPSVSSPRGTVRTEPTHVVYTRDATGRAKLFINGEQRAAGNIGGDLSNWNDDFRLAIANETTKDRPWRGTLHSVAIYSRALTPDEIRSKGAVMSRYELADVPSRGGLLTQGSVLTVGGDEASMVTRGLFVLHDLLYSAVGDPPPCVDTTPVPTKPGLSQRAIAMQRLSNGSCMGCHSKFEPLAFGLEKFDGLGTFHEVDEHGNKLREDGEILFPGEGEPVPYDTCAEFLDLLAGSERVKKNMTRKVTQFAIGRPLVESDAEIIDKIHEASQEGGGTYASLITAILMSDLVQKTRTDQAR